MGERSVNMENPAPLIVFLFIIISVFLEMRSQGKKTASSSKAQTNRTFRDYARDLMKHLEALDRDESSKKPISPVNTEKKTQVSRKDQVEPLRVDLDVKTDSQRRQFDQPAKIMDQNRVQKKVFLEEKRKPKVNSTLKKRLNKTGLRQSIIMAEVLGPPRSKQPYSQHRH